MAVYVHIWPHMALLEAKMALVLQENEQLRSQAAALTAEAHGNDMHTVHTQYLEYFFILFLGFVVF